jgi:hypothetical protein
MIRFFNDELYHSYHNLERIGFDFSFKSMGKLYSLSKGDETLIAKALVSKIKYDLSLLNYSELLLVYKQFIIDFPHMVYIFGIKYVSDGMGRTFIHDLHDIDEMPPYNSSDQMIKMSNFLIECGADINESTCYYNDYTSTVCIPETPLQYIINFWEGFDDDGSDDVEKLLFDRDMKYVDYLMTLDAMCNTNNSTKIKLA